MTPRTLVLGTAIALLLLGLPALFIPDVVAGWLGLADGAQFPLQLLGGALYAFAGLNWFGRGAVYGGIYGRPIVVANFILGLVSAGMFLLATLGGRVSAAGWLPTGVFALQATGFFRVMRRPPWGDHDSDSSRGGSI